MSPTHYEMMCIEFEFSELVEIYHWQAISPRRESPVALKQAEH